MMSSISCNYLLVRYYMQVTTPFRRKKMMSSIQRYATMIRRADWLSRGAVTAMEEEYMPTWGAGTGQLLFQNMANGGKSCDYPDLWWNEYLLGVWNIQSVFFFLCFYLLIVVGLDIQHLRHWCDREQGRIWNVGAAGKWYGVAYFKLCSHLRSFSLFVVHHPM